MTLARMAEQYGWPLVWHEPPEELVPGSGVWAVATIPMPDAPSRYVNYVEFDVRRLGDGTLVCYHDSVAGTRGPTLRTLSYQQLCKQVGYQVPTIAGLLDEFAGKAAGHVDLKETGYEDEVVRLVRDRLGEEAFVATTLEDVSIGAMVWTVDDTKQIDRLLSDARVDVLVTDRPRFAIGRRAGLA